MGDAEDDLADLYEDAEPRVLGFDGDELFVRTASGPVMSWDPRTGTRTEHHGRYDLYYFARRDPGGGQRLPALVRGGRLVVPRDPYRSTQPGHVSPGRKFILGGWTDVETAYGLAFDGSPFGPRMVRLVECRMTVEQRRCHVLRTIRAPAHELVLFPTGSAATDY